MKKILLSLFMFVCAIILVNAQEFPLEVYIVSTGDAVTDTLWNDMDTDEVEDDTITSIVTYYLSSDDAEEEYKWLDDEREIDDLFDDDLDAGWEPASDDQNEVSVGLRFQNITIPQGATIDSAFIVLTSHEDKAAEDTAKLTIKCEAADSAVTFTDDELFTTRDLTTAEVKWTVAEEWIIWEAYKTPELKTIVQEVIDRSGWKSGNALSFILKGEDQGENDDADNAREIESFENIADPLDQDHDGNPGDGKNHPERAPKLVVYYSTTTGVNNVNVDVFSIFPNPVENGILNINLNSGEKAAVAISNISGQIIENFEINSRNTIDISHYKKGIYFINVLKGESGYTQKFIVK